MAHIARAPLGLAHPHLIRDPLIPHVIRHLRASPRACHGI